MLSLTTDRQALAIGEVMDTCFDEDADVLGDCRKCARKCLAQYGVARPRTIRR